MARERTRMRWFYSFLEYVGILRCTIDIGGSEIRLLESIKLPFFYKVVRDNHEALDDLARFSFFMERFLEKNATHPLRRIHLTLSGPWMIPMFVSLPGIPKEKIGSVVQWEMEKHVPVPANQLYTGFSVLSHLNRKGLETWNVLALCAKKEDIDRITQCFKQLSIRILSLDYLPLSLFGALKPENSRASRGVIWIGHDSAYLAVLASNRIVHFSRYEGDFTNPGPLAIKNMVLFFSDFIRSDFIRRENLFLEKIVIAGYPPQEALHTLVHSMTESLNILTIPADSEDYQPILLTASKNPDLAAYDIGYFPKAGLPLFKKAALKDRLLRLAVGLVLLLDAVSVGMLVPMALTATEYRAFDRARRQPPSEISDPVIRKKAEELSGIALILSYEQKRRELQTLVRDALARKGEHSSFRLILKDISESIPADVWLDRIFLEGRQGELGGVALSTEGLGRFVDSLESSKGSMTMISLKKADSVSDQGRALVRFTIGFGVKP